MTTSTAHAHQQAPTSSIPTMTTPAYVPVDDDTDTVNDAAMIAAAEELGIDLTGPAPLTVVAPRIRPAARVRRNAEAREVAAQLLRPHAPITVIRGRRGSGRSTLVREVASVLAAEGHDLVLRDLQANPEHPASSVQSVVERLEAADAKFHRTAVGPVGGTVLVLDDFDLLAGLDAPSADAELLDAVVTTATRSRVRVLAVVREDLADRIEEIRPLRDLVHQVLLREMPTAELIDLLQDRLHRRELAPGMVLTPEALRAAAAPSDGDEDLAHPGLALSRTDTAVGRARLRGSTRVTDADLRPASDRPSAPDEQTLRRELAAGVTGQDQAIDTVAARLTPALAGLSLRPERPLGVFLFAGPSGVGKTELAKQIARVVHGSADAMIRLDMSEYGDAQDSRMRLIGAHKTWKNSTTEGLLTTRVRERPRCVLLLDEFEKAHRSVWQLFLQVFDEGRLTDGWGNTASFAETIIVLTSNLGVQQGAAHAAGFGAPQGFRSDGQLRAIREELPPELLGRISDLVAFSPLSSRALADLARRELHRVVERGCSAGWDITVDESAVELLAATGQDPRYGARHMQRAIESRVLPALMAAHSRTVRIRAVDGQVHCEDRRTVEPCKAEGEYDMEEVVI